MTCSSAAHSSGEALAPIAGQSSAGKSSSSESGRTRVTTPPYSNRLAKQISRGRANQVACRASAGLINESSNDSRRRTSELAAAQAGSESQLVVVGVNAGLQLVVV